MRLGREVTAAELPASERELCVGNRWIAGYAPEERTLRQMFAVSLLPFEMAARMRKHFRIGNGGWTLKRQ
jgi:hypothetical protein